MTMKLKDLKPAMSDWSVTGYVKKRNPLQSYKNSTKDKWFDFRFSDEETTLRIVCFKECSQKFDTIIQQGKFYQIKDGVIQENTFKNVTEIEIKLTNNSIITETSELNIPTFGVFTKLIQVPYKVGTKINVIGFIKNVEDEEKVIIDGNAIGKIDLLLYDEDAQIKVTIWNRKDELQKGQLVAFENVIIKEYNGGVQINVNVSSNITVDPECEMAEILKNTKNKPDQLQTPKKDVSHSSCNDKFTKQELLKSAEKELKEVDEMETKLAIKRKRLTNEIKAIKSLQF